MSNIFNVCPKCSSKNIEYKDGKKWFCYDCGFDLYNNVAAAVGVIICDDSNNVLFEVRNKNPRKGFLCLPGGFVNPDERAEDAIVRECKEEIGVELEDTEFLCTFPNIYEYKEIIYKTCDIFFTGKAKNTYKTIADLIKQLNAEKSEVQGFASYKINSQEDVERLPLAFESAKKTLKFWCERR